MGSKKWIFLITFLSFRHSNCYNIQLEDATLFRPETISGFHTNGRIDFGFTMAVQKASPEKTLLLVGAPKATMKNFRDETSSGAVYVCDLNSRQSTCKQFDFKEMDDQTIQRDMMFGATIVSTDVDKFITCGYGWKYNHSKYGWTMNGKCYQGDLSREEIRDVGILNNYSDEELGKDLSSAGMGFSIHRRDDKVIIGAAGGYSFRGSIVLHDLRGGSCLTDAGSESYQYTGYAVTSVRVGENKYVLASQPIADNMKSGVYAMSYDESSNCLIDATGRINLNKGDEKRRYSYYGSSLLGLDVDGNGYDELLVGAPFYGHHKKDEGAVFIYGYQAGNQSYVQTGQLFGGGAAWGRFGSAMVDIGDINLDGFRDVVISSPNENTGVIYLYLGNGNGFKEPYDQRISASSVNTRLNGFGYSMAHVVDEWGYPNLLVGAYKSNNVVFLKTKQIHHLEADINFSTDGIIWYLTHCSDDNNLEILFEVTLSFTYFVSPRNVTGSSPNSKPPFASLVYNLFIDHPNGRRGYYVDEKGHPCSKIERELDFGGVFPNNKIIHRWNITFPINTQPKNMHVPVKFFLNWTIPSSRDVAVVLNKSIPTSQFKSVNFSKECASDSDCQPKLSAGSPLKDSHNLLAYIIGSKEVLSAPFLINNTGETAYNVQILLSYPSMVTFNKMVAETACNSLSCENDPIDESSTGKNTDNRLKCYVNMPIRGQSHLLFFFNFNVQWLKTMASRIEMTIDDNAVTVDARTSYVDLDFYYKSEIKIINGSRSNTILHNTPSDEQFILTNIFDVRNHGPGVHPLFVLRIKIPIGKKDAEDVLCCSRIDLQIHRKDGTPLPSSEIFRDVTEEAPSMGSDKGQVVGDGGGTTPGIHLNCQTSWCRVHTILISNFALDDNLDININVSINQSLLEHIKKVPSFQYTSQLQIDCNHIFVGYHNYTKKNSSACGEIEIYESTFTAKPLPALPKIPIWLIIICVLLGILHLIILIAVLKKCGFFRRTNHEKLLKEKEALVADVVVDDDVGVVDVNDDDDGGVDNDVDVQGGDVEEVGEGGEKKLPG